MNFVYGTADHDIMYATDGSDWIYGLQGRDSIHGLGGKDIFVVYGGDDKEFIIDFQEGSDLVDLRQVGVSSFSQLELLFEYETDIVETSVSPMRLYLNLMNDPDGRVDIDPTDFIFTTTPVRNYGDGRDMVELSSNVYSVHLGNGGTDTLDLQRLIPTGATQGVTLTMELDRLGNGRLEARGVTQHFFDFENVYGSNANDSISGDNTANLLSGRSGNDVLFGAAGNDRLLGGVGADSLKGALGNDMLDGGSGRDLMWGGKGADIFVFHDNDNRVDVVMDFQDGSDRLDISDWGVTQVSQLTVTQINNGNLAVTHDGDGFILRGVGGDDLRVGDLTAADFIFT